MGRSLLGLVTDIISTAISERRSINEVFDSESVGEYGELLTDLELKKIERSVINGKILKNLYIPKSNGETTEIDLVFITRKGIFVIESKNYSGWIFGDEDHQYWTATLPNGHKNRFYNPIMQNKSHIKWLVNYLNENVSIYSLIVFSDRCEFKKIDCHSQHMSVIHRYQLVEEIIDVRNESPDIFNEDDIERLFRLLSPLTNIDYAVKAKHIENINRNHGTSLSYRKDQIHDEFGDGSNNKDICPRCGGMLVLRTAKRGANVGTQFYGCSNYPKCKYTKNI